MFQVNCVLSFTQKTPGASPTMSSGIVNLLHVAHNLHLGECSPAVSVHHGMCSQSNWISGSDETGHSSMERRGTVHIWGPHVWKLLFQRTCSNGGHHLLPAFPLHALKLVHCPQNQRTDRFDNLYAHLAGTQPLHIRHSRFCHCWQLGLQTVHFHSRNKSEYFFFIAETKIYITQRRSCV